MQRELAVPLLRDALNDRVIVRYRYERSGDAFAGEVRAIRP
jgi:hypothetical protein